jgi:hypothetical protein
MEWVTSNWFFLLFTALFIGMHLFGFGCGGRGQHGKHKEHESDDHKRHDHTVVTDGHFE